jgi:hypothetical protein
MADPIFRIESFGDTSVAVGSNGTILVSNAADGVWYQVYSGTTNHLYGVAYGAFLDTPMWVIVGEGGIVLRSPDGWNWTPQAPITTNDLYDVAFMGVFIAVGVGGELWLSEDLGAFWEQKTSGTTSDLHEVNVDLGQYIIVGADDTVITGNIYTLQAESLIVNNVSVGDTLEASGQFNHSFTDSFEAVAAAGGATAGQKVEFDIVGTPDVGDIYTITLDGVDYSYTVQSGDTLADIAAELAALIDASDKFFAYSDGETVYVTSNNPPIPYTYSSSATGTGTGIDVTEEQTSSSTVQIVEVIISGTVIPGDSFTVTIDGVDYTYVAQAGDTAITVAEELATLIDAAPNLIATAENGVITITSTDPTQDFTYDSTTTSTGATTEENIIQNSDIDGMTFYEYITEEIYPFDIVPFPYGAFNHEVIEVVECPPDGFPSEHIKGNANTETVTVGDIVVSEMMNGFGGDVSFYQIQTEGNFLTGTLWEANLPFMKIFAFGEIGIGISGEAKIGKIKTEGAFAQEVSFSGDIRLPRMRSDGALTLTQNGLIDAEGNPTTDYQVWVANIANAAHSTYTNFGCNSMVKFNGKMIGAFNDGIYEIGGHTDSGVKIAAKVYWVPTNLGDNKQKSIDSVAVNMRSLNQGSIKLVAIADEQKKRTFIKPVTGRAKGLQRYRQQMPLGLTAQTWQFGFENVSGGDFVLDEIEVISVELSRRFK